MTYVTLIIFENDKIEGELRIMSKRLMTRFVHKHDLEANWLKAENFIPMQGELIIYDIEVDSANNILETAYVIEEDGSKHLPDNREHAYTYQRFKIGDGIKKVANLQFYNESIENYLTDYIVNYVAEYDTHLREDIDTTHSAIITEVDKKAQIIDNTLPQITSKEDYLENADKLYRVNKIEGTFISLNDFGEIINESSGTVRVVPTLPSHGLSYSQESMHMYFSIADQCYAAYIDGVWYKDLPVNLITNRGQLESMTSVDAFLAESSTTELYIMNPDFLIGRNPLIQIATDPSSFAAKNDLILLRDSLSRYSLDSHKHTISHTPEGQVASIFTGTEQSVTVSGTPEGTISDLVFTGSESTLSLNYTPTGTLSEPIFTGTKYEDTIDYTPSGNISQPEFTGDEMTSKGTLTPSGSVSAPTIDIEYDDIQLNSVVSCGTSPELQKTYDPNTQRLKLTWNAGTLPSIESKTVLTSVSATADAPVFTGDLADITVKGTPNGTVSQPIFTGDSVEFKIEMTPEGTISTPTFEGNATVLEHTYTPEGTISKPIFTGKPMTSTGEFTPNGTIDSTFIGTSVQITTSEAFEEDRTNE